MALKGAVPTYIPQLLIHTLTLRESRDNSGYLLVLEV